MRIAIGADHGGYDLKEELKAFITSLGHEVVDVGCRSGDAVDYPDYALPVCQKVISGEVQRGVLICGTGIGMSIAANKVPGIRCALLHDMFSAKVTREHNDSNVMAMGARVVGPGLAQEIVRTWLEAEFSHAARHEQRISKIDTLEAKFANQPES